MNKLLALLSAILIGMVIIFRLHRSACPDHADTAGQTQAPTSVVTNPGDGDTGFTGVIFFSLQELPGDFSLIAMEKEARPMLSVTRRSPPFSGPTGR